jgi:serine phosphatase RsbU (regulator of sigma subunit)
LHAVVPARDGVLLAVLDGLGHGEEARAAARAAVEILEKSPDAAVDALLQECHRALHQTRGAVMTLMTIHPRPQTASVIGVGNVEAVLLRNEPAARPWRESVLLRGGIVGYKLPPLQVETWPIAAGDVFVFATDGVRDDFAEGVNPADPLPELVEKIMSRCLRGTDDALVLAGKFLGHET